MALTKLRGGDARGRYESKARNRENGSLSGEENDDMNEEKKVLTFVRDDSGQGFIEVRRATA
jgi:hypothetical protein